MTNAFRLPAWILCFGMLSTAMWADTVTFGEIVLPTGTELSTQYAAYDLNFSDTYYAVTDKSLFTDGYGIAEASVPATIQFIQPVANVSIDWLAVATTFTATAYDVNNNQLSTFSSNSSNEACYTTSVQVGQVCTGVALLAGTDIAKVVWHDDLGYVGIDSVSFSQVSDPSAVPEPSAMIPLLASVIVLMLPKRTPWYNRFGDLRSKRRC